MQPAIRCNDYVNKMIGKYRTLVNDDLGSADGALIFDESGFIKKGQDSVGVARQYCGTIGKVDNCQVGVFAAYVSEYGYMHWSASACSLRKSGSATRTIVVEKCKLPTGTALCTKPQLAAEMFNAVVKEDVLPCKYVPADPVSPDFIEAVESLPDKTCFVSVPKDTIAG